MVDHVLGVPRLNSALRVYSTMTEAQIDQFTPTFVSTAGLRKVAQQAGRLFASSFKAIANRILSLLRYLPAGQRADVVDLLLHDPVMVDTPHGKIRFLNHSRLSYTRARTIMSKEPDSMKWIDAMKQGSVFWDIGANVGVLTLYAAMRGDIEVWAFEPAAVNYYNLVANCELNRLEERVRCWQLGFGGRSAIANLHVSQLMSARSFTFKQSKNPKKGYPSVQTAQLYTVDAFRALHGTASPNYIKIDVPGLTEEIFSGAKQTLACPALREIQVEASERTDGRRIAELLAPLGFRMVQRGMRDEGRLQRDLVFARDA